MDTSLKNCKEKQLRKFQSPHDQSKSNAKFELELETISIDVEASALEEALTRKP